MIPNDLSVFSIEQLRGFLAAVKEQLTAVPAQEDLTAEQRVESREKLADDRDRLTAAIETKLDAESAEAAVDAAAGEPDPDAAADGDDEPELDEDGNPIVKPDAAAEGDAAEGAVDDAVAAATMGGGATAPAATRDEARKAGGDMRKFIRRLGNGNVSTEERHSFSAMRRETKHVVREGALASDDIRAAITSRADGSDKTAAGCFCGPDDAVNTIKESGETVRPISDTLPTLTVSGDIRYIRELDLVDALTGVTQWTCTDQDAVDPSDIATWKPCFELDCQPEQTSGLYAVSACASFTTQQFIGNPALVANLEHVMEVAYNKTAELLVYQRLRDLASKYTFGYDLAGYGAEAQLIAAVGWALELVKANLRESDPNYTLAIPAGLKQRILTDAFLVGAKQGDETWAEVVAKIQELGVRNVVELVDEIVCSPDGPVAHATPAAAVDGCDGTYIAAPAHPVEQEILLYRPEDFVLGVAPEIDLGVTRSPELARQNKLQWFVESFEFVEKIGNAPAIDLVVPFCASGVRPALGTGEDCTP